MRGILHGLYSGKVVPWERRAPDNEKQRDVLHKIESEEYYFMEKMSPDDRKRFQALSNLQAEMAFVEEDDIFSYGFTLGLLMMMDITEEAKRITGE